MAAVEIIEERRLPKDADDNARGVRVFIVDGRPGEIDFGTDGLPNKGDPFDSVPPGSTVFADAIDPQPIGLRAQSRVTISYSNNRANVFYPSVPFTAPPFPVDSTDPTSQITSWRTETVETRLWSGGYVARSIGDALPVQVQVWLYDGGSESSRQPFVAEDRVYIIQQTIELTSALNAIDAALMIGRVGNADVLPFYGRCVFDGPITPISEETKTVTYQWTRDLGTKVPAQMNTGESDGFYRWALPPLDGSALDLAASLAGFYRLAWHDLVPIQATRDVDVGAGQPFTVPDIGTVTNVPRAGIRDNDPGSYASLPGNPNFGA